MRVLLRLRQTFLGRIERLRGDAKAHGTDYPRHNHGSRTDGSGLVVVLLLLLFVGRTLHALIFSPCTTVVHGCGGAHQGKDRRV